NLLALKFEASDYNHGIECRGILQARSGEIYINSYAGTFQLSPDGNIGSSNFLNVPDPLKWGAMALCEDRAGDAWFGWLRPVRRDARTGAFKFYQLPAGIADLNIWAIYQQPSGRMWFAGVDGDFGFLEMGADTVQLFKNYEAFSELKSANILSMQERPDGMVWLVANTGLYVFDPSAQKILQRYWTGGTDGFYLPNDDLHHLCQDGDSLLWLATGGGGLLKLAVARGTISSIQQFTRADGLSSNVLYAVYKDDFGNLWLSSDYGIIQFNKATGFSRAFLPGDGLPHTEFNRISHYQAKDGQLYFGSLNGVTTFHPLDFQHVEIANDVPLVLLDLQQFDGQANRMVDKMKDFAAGPEIVLRPGDGVVNLEFSLLDFNTPEQIRYAYRLEGLDETWVYLRENRISLLGLQYGNFILRIKGQTATGVFSSQELAIPIRVLRPFYLQEWFFLLAGLFSLGAIFGFYKIRITQLKQQKRQLETEVQQRTRTIRQQNEQLEQQAGELQSLEKLKSRFFANVSHELRTPLTLILGPVNSLLKRSEKNGNDHKLYQFIERNARQLQKLINEILDLSKLEVGKLEVVEEPVLFFPYLKEQLAQFKSAASSDGLDLAFEYRADESLNLMLDKSKFEKIVHNFLSNALKFTPPGGRVTLVIEELEDHPEASGQDIQLSVADTGPGIHPDDLPHIFDRFYQAPPRPSPTGREEDSPSVGGGWGEAGGGTGIGLSLCKELAQLLGGDVWAESEWGSGSVFYFKFPKKEAAGEPVASIPELRSGQESPGNKPPETGFRDTFPEDTNKGGNRPPSAVQRPPSTILVVEDNPDLREYLHFLLSDYQVFTAGNGQAALDFLTIGDRQPDLIISDLMMPVMNGFQFLERLKSDDRWRHLPVIMLTAKVNARAKLEALRIGVDDYLTKPFEEEELIARIENLLRNYRERMQYFSENGTDGAAEPVAGKPVIAQVDSDWLKEVEAIFSKNISDRNFTLEWVAAQLNLSQRQFGRRLQPLTGLSPNLYLQEMRLQLAKVFLLNGKFTTVKETGYAVGFRDTPYFSTLFQERFGVAPSAYLR
ncbi:MAG: response regulator, partial [Saprospiraceae bacterium]